MDCPQMWIGSSLAVGFETEFSDPSAAPDPLVAVFDWGRSEFNTPENHGKLTREEKEQRIYYWRVYLQGIVRILFQGARIFLHRY